ncbi:MAG: hypothetical protein JNK48_03820 [Bryobacterales bacterium]|nr:hypothetical protein [Bryobacterales bacterium]
MALPTFRMLVAGERDGEFSPEACRSFPDLRSNWLSAKGLNGALEVGDGSRKMRGPSVVLVQKMMTARLVQGGGSLGQR